jgi:hypothetical protein
MIRVGQRTRVVGPVPESESRRLAGFCRASGARFLQWGEGSADTGLSMTDPTRPLPSTTHARRWITRALLAAAMTAGALVAAGPADAALSDGAPRWQVTVPGGRVHWSSPAIADIDGDGAQDVVVGGLDGRVHAYDADGAPLPGWPATALVGGTASAVASSPAVADLDGNGTNDVVVGTGSLERANQHGGIVVFNRDGTRRCTFQTGDKFNQWTGGPPDGYSDGVFNAPALGDVTGDGRPEIVFGAWDHQIRVLDASCRQLAAFDNTDTVWSAPALFDSNGDGRDEIFIGGDATSYAGSPSGGFFRALRYTGAAQLSQLWVRLSSESFQSASAIGDINGDGRLEVVTGSGRFYCLTQGRCGDSTKVWAFDLATGNDVPGWPRNARYDTFLSAPAIGDVNGDGRTDVVIGSFRGGHGSVVAFDGSGQPLWEVEPAGDELLSSPVIADVDAAAGNEVIAGSGGRVHVLSGTTGATLRSVGAGAYKNAVAVGELGPGRWALVAAGFQPENGYSATITAWDIAPPAAAPWPMFGQGAARQGLQPAGPLPEARDIDDACPSGDFQAAAITDVSTTSPHRRAIDCASWWSLTQTTDGLYKPTRAVTRAQMASFIARLIDQTSTPLPSGAPDAFTDDEGSAYVAHEANINRLTAAGIVTGRTASSYGPGLPVTRGQMATFLVRAHLYVTGDLLTLNFHWFRDWDRVHGDNADRAASASVATGFSNGTFRPGVDVRRDQMASFLVRLLDLLVEGSHATPPSA